MIRCRSMRAIFCMYRRVTRGFVHVLFEYSYCSFSLCSNRHTSLAIATVSSIRSLITTSCSTSSVPLYPSGILNSDDAVKRPLAVFLYCKPYHPINSRATCTENVSKLTLPRYWDCGDWLCLASSECSGQPNLQPSLQRLPVLLHEYFDAKKSLVSQPHQPFAFR